MKITALEEYGLRCLLQIVAGKEKGASISEISEREGLSIQYVSKILSILKKKGLVAANRGVKGGYYLTQEPQTLKLSEVLRMLGGVMFDKDFCGEHTGKETVCVHDQNCAVRSIWSVVYSYVYSILDQLTLADLLTDEGICREHMIKTIFERKKEKALERTLKVIND